MFKSVMTLLITFILTSSVFAQSTDNMDSELKVSMMKEAQNVLAEQLQSSTLINTEKLTMIKQHKVEVQATMKEVIKLGVSDGSFADLIALNDEAIALNQLKLDEKGAFIKDSCIQAKQQNDRTNGVLRDSTNEIINTLCK